MTGPRGPLQPDQAEWAALAPPEDARALAESARSHFASAGPLTRMRTALTGTPVPGGWAQWSEYAEIGLPGSAGGVGDLVDLAVLLEEAGRALIGDSLLASSAAIQAQVAGGVPHDRLRTGRGAFGVTTGSVTGTRVSTGPGLVLDGRDAETLTLLVRSDAGPQLALVPSGVPGLGVTGHDAGHDPTRPIVTVQLDQVVPADLVEISPAAATAAQAAARVCVAADLTGTAAAALQRSIEHARQRVQFGQLIGAFQAVKHQLADTYVLVEKARSLTLGAAAELAAGARSERVEQLSLLAGATATGAAFAATDRYVQLLGAMGVTFEADPHLYFRRAHQTALALEPRRVALARAADLERGRR